MEIANVPATVLLIARGETSVVGMLTLVLFRAPTRVRALMPTPHDLGHGVAMEILEQQHDLEAVRA